MQVLTTLARPECSSKWQCQVSLAAADFIAHSHEDLAEPILPFARFPAARRFDSRSNIALERGGERASGGRDL
jgi:hypothetical protein